ncbi:uncharacterized protein APUU_40581A [Aspergillus puulaauensis]|uniref:Uncharacterized protein n=1 Tax=Aspergillus puulaauensis TaxID=1220207 RepID=A0A7R7XMZ7_9EURO|nr:uncharacterized protein APUU_40581A [Aspergillus puulaauensis]BCS24137.1 hypothetical protein APUU_40581A [Aspergillus puulaauensis]
MGDEGLSHVAVACFHSRLAALRLSRRLDVDFRWTTTSRSPQHRCLPLLSKQHARFPVHSIDRAAIDGSLEISISRPSTQSRTPSSLSALDLRRLQRSSRVHDSTMLRSVRNPQKLIRADAISRLVVRLLC